MWFTGIIAGIGVAFFGSFILSLHPYLSFFPLFLTTVMPSSLTFVIVVYRIKPDLPAVTCWLYSFISLFVISMFAFAIKNYLETRSTFDNPGIGMNWDAVFIANILYAIGAAVLLSPLSFLVIKRIALYKKEKNVNDF